MILAPLGNRLFAICTTILIASAVTPLQAEKPKSSDFLLVSGERAILRWRNRDSVNIRGTVYWTDHERITLTPREGIHVPLAVAIWVRGIPELDLMPAADFDEGKPCAAQPRSVLKLDVAAPTSIIYRICVPAAQFERAQGEISVAALGSDPERLPVSYEREEGFFESPFVNALLSPVFAVAGGILLGAVFGFFSFWAQQRYLRWKEYVKTFDEKKLQRLSELSRFFRDEYDGFLQSDGKVDDMGQARRIRGVLRGSGVYPILPPHEIRRLNKICDAKLFLGRSRVAAMDELIVRNFAEFIHREKQQAVK